MTVAYTIYLYKYMSGGFFFDKNTPDRIMALGSNQSLTEMRIIIIPYQ